MCGRSSGTLGRGLWALSVMPPFAVKAAVGIAMHSISVTADAFNNLSDAASSVIGLVGVKLAGKPADKEHPFGHGRMEYITALVVSFLVIEVGLTFFKDAFSRIWNPQKLEFQFISVLILVLSIGVKLWMSLFNRKLGKRIDSKVMLATAADAVGDVITTSATVISLLFFYFTGINIDGVIGVCVSLVVIWRDWNRKGYIEAASGRAYFSCRL